MTELDFDFLRVLLQRRSGLFLSTEKRYLVESRLGMLCRRRGIAGIPSLVAQLRSIPSSELEAAVVEAMTTNETLFFRDRTPFDLVRDVILPEALANKAHSRTLRIWCAAVSTGQEAYSLAMLLDEAAERLAGWKIEILGTDISLDVLERAKLGLYSQFEVQRGLPIQLLLRYFRQEGDKWRLTERIRDMVQFRQHNLLEPNHHLGQFELILCRNVLIYFDVPTKARVMAALAARLAANGAFILGAAETVIGITTTLVPDPAHRGIYRDASQARPAQRPGFFAPPAERGAAPATAKLARP
ncbi:protein-glutamate O-methyltransferase CheR [Bosea sp. CS1GBMeth4]|uniref:CheR family methyltransferase n=1 Tax=Bosea sp. CS1GBMeth4 TaxID=1892849 RepID=UPI00164713BA|nr:protein-glutamate O-methyltransferase CheR [Bosea sp. CS1GBMeth4]